MKFEHKMAPPAKWPKCRYDFIAFTWWTAFICTFGPKSYCKMKKYI